MLQRAFCTSVEFGHLFGRKFVVELVTKLLKNLALLFNRKQVNLL